MEICQSSKGKVMLEKQRDSRRQRHISALTESTKFVDQYYDTFSEKKNSVRQGSTKYILRSDERIAEIVKGLTDEDLLANEIAYVN